MKSIKSMSIFQRRKQQSEETEARKMLMTTVEDSSLPKRRTMLNTPFKKRKMSPILLNDTDEED